MRNYNYIGSMTAREVGIIERCWKDKSDREIGEMIGRPFSTIKNYRIKHGLIKPKGFRAYGFTIVKKQKEESISRDAPNNLMKVFLSGKI